MIDLAAVLSMIAAPRQRGHAAAAAASARVRCAAARLPAGLTDTVYFEHWMAEEPARIDMICRVSREHRALLSSSGQRRWLPAVDRAHAAWMSVASFVDAWCRAGSPLDRSVQHIWLEFDLPPGGACALPPPGIFTDFTRDVLAAADRTVPAAAVRTVLSVLVPSMDARLVTRVCDAVSGLPDGTTMPYLGVLLPRGSDVVRICLEGLSDVGLASFLQARGWAGDLATLHSTLSAWQHDVAPAPVRSLLHMDVALTPVRGLAIELKCDRRPQVTSQFSESRFLDGLVRRGALSAELADHVRRWPGCELRTLPHQFWTSLVTRRVNHFKVVLRQDGALDAKAYLSVSHRHFRRAAVAITPAAAVAAPDAFL